MTKQQLLEEKTELIVALQGCCGFGVWAVEERLKQIDKKLEGFKDDKELRTTKKQH